VVRYFEWVVDFDDTEEKIILFVIERNREGLLSLGRLLPRRFWLRRRSTSEEVQGVGIVDFAVATYSRVEY